MLKFDCVQTQSFVMPNNKKTVNKQQSFGMNPILIPKTRTSPNLGVITVDIYQHVGQASTVSIEVSSQNTSTPKSLSPIEVLIGKAETTEDKPTIQNENATKIPISRAQTAQTFSLKNIKHTSDDYDFQEKDAQADKYFNNCCNTFSKVSSVIPILGGIGAFQLAYNSGRNKKLDEIYGVPEYLPVKTKMSMDTYWIVTAALHFSVWLSPIATPMALVGLCLNNKEKKDLKNAYREAYKKEQEEVKNETPEQTKLRHERLKREYEAEKIRKAIASSNSSSRRRSYHHSSYSKNRNRPGYNSNGRPKYSPAGMAYY